MRFRLPTPGGIAVFQRTDRSDPCSRSSSSSSATTIRLDFIKPFEVHNIADFTLESPGDSTVVIWTMHGQKPYIAKLMHLLFNIDKRVGGDYERGLANLKAAAEEN